jgi:hypothetical protein
MWYIAVLALKLWLLGDNWRSRSAIISFIPLPVSKKLRVAAGAGVAAQSFFSSIGRKSHIIRGGRDHLSDVEEENEQDTYYSRKSSRGR